MSIVPNLPQLLTTKSQEALKAFQFQCYAQYNQNWAMRNNMLVIDKQYARELDYDTENLRAKRANRAGDKSRFQNITIPIVLSQVESAVTYQSSVFLTGVPLFGVAAPPAFMDEAIQMESLIDDQSIRGGWTRELTMLFRDGAKYNLTALEVDWCREVTYSPETVIAAGNKNGTKPKEIIWEGNRIRRWDLYNTFFDTRVAPAEMHKKGEFIGRTELMSRIMLKQFVASLPDARIDNLKEAFESGTATINTSDTSGDVMAFYIPQVNPNVILNPSLTGSTNWLAWAGIAGRADGNIQYRNMYEVTTLYCRILTSDFGINGPDRNTPQIWKLIFVNHQVLIYAERQTNAHGYLPVLMCQPNEDGLNLQTKSLAENVSPIQDITSALSNSDIAARRRAISDRTLYDPSRVNSADINSTNPSAKIPVRPAAYGKPLSEAVFPFPFRDDQSQFIQQKIQSYTALANMISGQNPVRQGQFVKGNKTQTEFSSVMDNANGRDQITAMAYETQMFTPMKEILKINILQYQGGTSLYSRGAQNTVTVDPIALRKAVLSFKVSDGLTPKDKQMDTDSITNAMQIIGSSPTIGAAYNIGPLFSYVMKLGNAHITDFEKSPAQQAFEAAQQQYQQMILQIYQANKEVNPKTLPPAPLPQDYGYNPAATTAGQDTSKTQGNSGTQPVSTNPAPSSPANNPVSSALQQSVPPA